jgi:hypothetical protein
MAETFRPDSDGQPDWPKAHERLRRVLSVEQFEHVKTVFGTLHRDEDEIADIYRALLLGCERRYFSAYSPAWFAERDAALTDVQHALRKLAGVLRRVGAGPDVLDGVTAALHDVPLVTLRTTQPRREGRPRNAARDVASRALRRVRYLSERERRELLDAAGLTAKLDRQETP